MGETDTSVIITIIVYGVPLIGLIISIFTFYASVRERHQKTAAEQAKIGVKLDNNAEKLDDIVKKVEDLGDGYHENRESIERHDQRLENLEERADKLEERFDRLEDKVNRFHTH